jgi:hypothetical protein
VLIDHPLNGTTSKLQIKVSFLAMSKPSRLEILEVDPPPASFSARCNRLLDHPSAAIVLALASDAFFVSMDGTVQNLESEGVSTGQAAALRFVSPTPYFLLVA